MTKRSRASSAWRVAKNTIASAAPRTLAVTPILCANPPGAPTSATRVDSVIPSFFGSGVVESSRLTPPLYGRKSGKPPGGGFPRG
jgi:hypothetical protein